jgi:hypothetical protein
MAQSTTADQINALLDPGASGRGIRIIDSVINEGTGSTNSYYVDGGATAPGRARWIDVDNSQTAAAQVTAIIAAMNAG